MKKRKLNKVKIISVMFVIIAFIAIMNNFEIGKTQEKYMTLTVQQNDTLWNIAANKCNSDSNIQNKITKIKKVNNLKNSNIYVGQTLYIPM